MAGRLLFLLCRVYECIGVGVQCTLVVCFFRVRRRGWLDILCCSLAVSQTCLFFGHIYDMALGGSQKEGEREGGNISFCAGAPVSPTSARIEFAPGKEHNGSTIFFNSLGFSRKSVNRGCYSSESYLKNSTNYNNYIHLTNCDLMLKEAMTLSIL